MSSDELKSEEKRKEDEAIEEENLRKAMTAVEEKAISTTYVSVDTPLTDTAAYINPAFSSTSAAVARMQGCFAFE